MGELYCLQVVCMKRLKLQTSVYTGTDIDGTLDKNNIYTNISSIDLSKMQKQDCLAEFDAVAEKFYENSSSINVNIPTIPYE